MLEAKKGFEMKYLYGFFAMGAIGAIVASLFAPQLIAWYFTPPVEPYLNCSPATTWAMNKLIMIQVISLIFFGMIGLFLAARMRTHKPAPTAPPLA